MITLLHHGWPWLVIGLMLTAWGVKVVGLSLIDWIQFWLRLPFIYFSDDTEDEKIQAKETLEEVAQANPGCFLFGLGLIAIIVGMVKLVT